MISDVLWEAVEEMRKYQADMPDVYGELKPRLDKLIADMEAMRIELDTDSDSDPAPRNAEVVGGSAMMTEILIPQSQRWDQFIEALVLEMHRYGCDGDGPDVAHRHAKKIMEAMGGVDIAGTIRPQYGTVPCAPNLRKRRLLFTVIPDRRNRPDVIEARGPVTQSSQTRRKPPPTADIPTTQKAAVAAVILDGVKLCPDADGDVPVAAACDVADDEHRLAA